MLFLVFSINVSVSARKHSSSLNDWKNSVRRNAASTKLLQSNFSQEIRHKTEKLQAINAQRALVPPKSVSKKEFKGLVIQTAMNAEATSPRVSLVDSQS